MADLTNINNITTNIDQLLSTLNDTDNILINNSLVESDIRSQGGTILYSYNNIIIASEISDTYWIELQKNPNIDYIQDLPLKQYGEIDYSIINQMSSSALFNRIENSGNTSGSTINTKTGIYPIITNTISGITVATNDSFSYAITATGSESIIYQVIKPDNYSGTLEIKDINILTGTVTKPGIYNVTIKAINGFGSYTKDLVISTDQTVSITNTNLNIYNILGSKLSYSIETDGGLPKTYDITGAPLGLSLSGNIISGIISKSGEYDMKIIVSGATNSDSKDLKINVGSIPIITSPTIISSEVNSAVIYTITSSDGTGTTYSISGTLNKGLTFKNDMIIGTPTIVGSNTVTIKAKNAFGSSTQSLTITIIEMNSI
jgi:hypothetical protein